MRCLAEFSTGDRSLSLSAANRVAKPADFARRGSSEWRLATRSCRSPFAIITDPGGQDIFVDMRFELVVRRANSWRLPPFFSWRRTHQRYPLG